MGFSVSASTALIFAALFLALGIFYPAMANSYERVQAADAGQADRALDQADSDIQIDSTASGEVDVTNSGSTALPVNETDLLLDGEYQPRSTVTTDVGGNTATDLWLPGETLTLDPDAGLNGVSQVRVVTEHGVSASAVI
jgi:Putative archaeal flagellar protein F